VQPKTTLQQVGIDELCFTLKLSVFLNRVALLSHEELISYIPLPLAASG